MSHNSLSLIGKKCAMLSAAILFGLTAASGWAATATSGTLTPTPGPATHEQNEEIIIHAPETVVKRTPADPRPYRLQNAEVITGEKPVTFADLDLSKPGDVMELQRRISDTARDICQELNRRYPRTQFQVVVDRDCVRAATDDAMGVMKDLIAANK
jgi:UrcA family protein